MIPNIVSLNAIVNIAPPERITIIIPISIKNIETPPYIFSYKDLFFSRINISIKLYQYFLIYSIKIFIHYYT